MKTQIFFQTITEGISVIAAPYHITVEWGAERTETFKKYGDAQMLNAWCRQVLSHRFPQYKCQIIDIKTIN